MGLALKGLSVQLPFKNLSAKLHFCCDVFSLLELYPQLSLENICAHSEYGASLFVWHHCSSLSKPVPGSLCIILLKLANLILIGFDHASLGTLHKISFFTSVSFFSLILFLVCSTSRCFLFISICGERSDHLIYNGIFFHLADNDLISSNKL